MKEADAMDLVMYLLVLILPLSALFARRLPIAATLKMALAWVAIFGVLLILVGQREHFRPLWDGARSTLTGEEQMVTGGTVRVPMGSDGHFHVTATINGVARRMLVDSGATATALSADTARAANVAADPRLGAAFLSTANGNVTAARGEIADFRIGSISAAGLPVVIASEFGDTDVLGMNFLSRLGGWRVEGRTLVLEAKPQ